MQDDSIKVKVGQKVEAGTPLGKMGTTGMSTGKHLHWELKVGKTHTWNDTGEGYIEPVAFFEALVAKEKAISTAPVKSDPNVVAPEPVHGEDIAVTTPSPSPTTAKPKAKAVMYTVKSGDSYWAIAEKYHAKFGGDSEVGQYVKKLQTWNKSAPLKPGDKVRVS
jgi:LysM repeat protein